jgi:hypothetical protein
MSIKNQNHILILSCMDLLFVELNLLVLCDASCKMGSL